MTTAAMPSGQFLKPPAASRLLTAAMERGCGTGAFTRLALVSGARRGELLQTRWPDVSPCADGTGCGVMVIACRDGGKTRHARRRIILDPRTMSMLAAWLEERRAAAGWPEGGSQRYVFSGSPSGEPAWQPHRVTRQVTALAAQTGVSASMIALRRYSMVRLSALGVAQEVIGRRLGLNPAMPPRLRTAEASLAADRKAATLLARELDDAVAEDHDQDG